MSTSSTTAPGTSKASSTALGDKGWSTSFTSTSPCSEKSRSCLPEGSFCRGCPSICTPLHREELVKCQGASTGSSENLCFQEAKGTHMAWPNQKPGKAEGRTRGCIPQHLQMEEQFCTSEVSQQLKCALPGHLPAHRSCLLEHSPATPAAHTWPWCPVLTPWARGTQHLPQADLPSSQGRNSRRLSLGIAWFFCCEVFFSFFFFFLSEVNCKLWTTSENYNWKTDI